MSQFDVHRNIGRTKASLPYVVIVQSRRFDLSLHRLVIPMMLQSEFQSREPRLHPTFDVEGNAVVLDPLQMASITINRLGERVGSLRSEADRIVAAIDLVISRAWD